MSETGCVSVEERKHHVVHPFLFTQSDKQLLRQFCVKKYLGREIVISGAFQFTKIFFSQTLDDDIYRFLVISELVIDAILTSSSLNCSLFSPSPAVIGLQILSMLSQM